MAIGDQTRAAVRRLLDSPDLDVHTELKLIAGILADLVDEPLTVPTPEPAPPVEEGEADQTSETEPES